MRRRHAATTSVSHRCLPARVCCQTNRRPSCRVSHTPAQAPCTRTRSCSSITHESSSINFGQLHIHRQIASSPEIDLGLQYHQSAVLLWQSCLFVCPSVTLRYRDHIGWNSSKIISPLFSLGCSLFADPNITDLLQGEHPEILIGIGEGYRKSGFRCTKALISLNRGKIGPRLLLRTNRKSNARFRLVPKSTTLDDL